MPHKVQSLPFGDEVTRGSSASAVAPGAGLGVGPALGEDDPDADLDGLSDDDLRRHIDELKASRDRRHDVVERLLKGIGILEHRGLLARPRGLWWAPASDALPAVRPERSRASARRRFSGLLRRVNQAGGAAAAEALAEFLAVDLVDSGSIGRFRTIARGIHEGVVEPQTVRDAYTAAKKPGVERPGALFVWFVRERSPGMRLARAAGR